MYITPGRYIASVKFDEKSITDVAKLNTSSVQFKYYENAVCKEVICILLYIYLMYLLHAIVTY